MEISGLAWIKRLNYLWKAKRLINMSLTSVIEELLLEIKKAKIDPAKGLGDELFLAVTSLTPIVNVDILIVKDGSILLSWRDDEQCGVGWRLPGGCVRLKETIEQRVHACARSELGSDVFCDMKPVLITENIEPKRDIGRSHFISFLYRCELVDESQLQKLDNQEIKGHLGWFDQMPEHFLPVQEFYRNTIIEIIERRD